MVFEMTHNYFDSESEVFTDLSAPDWLTGAKTVKGSTADNRWFWNDYVLVLGVGESLKTEFRTITRIE